jgi:hypothetical protein
MDVTGSSPTGVLFWYDVTETAEELLIQNKSCRGWQDNF